MHRVEDLRQLPENLEQASRQRLQQRRFGPILLVGGVLVMVLAMIPARHILALQTSGLRGDRLIAGSAGALER